MKVLVKIILLVALIAGCGDKVSSDGGDPGTTFDIVGTWQVHCSTASMTSGNCTYNAPERTINYIITKSGDMITLTLENGEWIDCYVNGNTYTATTTYQDVAGDGKPIQVNFSCVYTQTSEEVFTGTETNEIIFQDGSGTHCTLKFDISANKL